MMCMEEWEILHGYPLDINEVTCIKSTLPYLLGFGPFWAEILEREKKNLGFFPLSPKLELVRVCFIPKRMW